MQHSLPGVFLLYFPHRAKSEIAEEHTIREEPVYVEYSENRAFRFEIDRHPDFYEIWVQRKVTDEYLGPDWFAYYDIPDYLHRADTMERAIEIGREGLRRFA